jgi:hypothetical protein
MSMSTDGVRSAQTAVNPKSPRRTIGSGPWQDVPQAFRNHPVIFNNQNQDHLFPWIGYNGSGWPSVSTTFHRPVYGSRTFRGSIQHLPGGSSTAWGRAVHPFERNQPGWIASTRIPRRAGILQQHTFHVQGGF